MIARQPGSQATTLLPSASGPDAPTLLSVRDLSVEFPGEEEDCPTRVVDRVSFDLRPGEVLGVVGESGSGKTLSMLSVMGLVPSPGRIVEGSVELDGIDLRGLSGEELRRRRGRDLGMIFQNPASSFNPLSTIGDQIIEALEVHDGSISRRQARIRTRELLRSVGVPDPDACFSRYPHEYSGGMLQRSMIAMAMANSPRVLIADEPTTALDVTIQAQVLDLLARVRAETGTAIVLVTHNLGLVGAIADRICVMYASRVVEQGPVAEVLAEPTHPYTAALLGSLPRMGQLDPVLPIPGRMPSLSELPPGCAFHPRCRLSHGRTLCVDKSPVLRSFGASQRLAACHFAEEQQTVGLGQTVEPAIPVGPAMIAQPAKIAEPEPAEIAEPDRPARPAAGPKTAESAADPALLEVRQLCKHFQPRSGLRLFGRVPVRAVDGIDLTLHRGHSMALIGESGCGKSTLARTVLRLSSPSAGQIRFDGDDITHLRGRRLRRVRTKMQMVFQDPVSALDPRLSVWDTVSEPLRYHKTGTPAEITEKVTRLLGLVEMDARLAHRRPHEYSGGQQQRIAIARSLALSPALLVLDEPLSALDVSIQAGMINMLNRVRAELGLTYLVISHDLSVVQHLCQTVSVMYLGQIIETGPTLEVFAHPRHPYTRALLSAVPDPDPVLRGRSERIVLTGEIPSPTSPPSGCRFRTRCWKAQDICAEQQPPLSPVEAVDGGSVACHFPE